MSFSSSSLTPSSPPLPSPYSHFLPSASSLSSLLLRLPFPFLSISAIPVPSLPPAPLFPFRPQPILSPPPSTLTLPIYTHSLLPLASLFTPLPYLFPLSPPSDERDEGYPILLMREGEAQRTLIFHSPLGGERARGEIGIKYPRRRTPEWVRRLGSTSGEE